MAKNFSVDNIIIRKETENDYYNTEHMVMRAFWNIHGPGCNEHLLAHKLRNVKEYIPELSRIAELEGKIVGVIMYSKAKIIDSNNKEHEVLTFGPLAVEPTCFNKGIGTLLLKTTLQLAKEACFSGIVICGEPEYYPRHGFIPCDKFGIEHSQYGNFDAFMAYSLNKEFENVHGKYYDAPVFEECNDPKELQEFNKQFPNYEPLKLSCQWLHKEKLGQISKIQKDQYFIKFWEEEIPAKIKDNLSIINNNHPNVSDYVTFEYNPLGDSFILSKCEKI